MNNKMQKILVLLATLVSLQGCATLTEEEREQIAYDLNEARAVYEERRRSCLESSGQMVTESLTGSRRLSISEMKWAYCRR
jgi:uncharacterized protein YceK